MAEKAAAPHAAHAAHVDDDHHGGDHDAGHGGGHCPPPWIITFADMVTLLMAFFVMLLMTSKPDQPKFNAFAASMRDTFGTNPVVPEAKMQGGNSVLELNWGPQSGAPTNERPQTSARNGKSNPDKTPRVDDPASKAAKALAEAMKKAVADGKVTVQSDAGSVVVKLPRGASAESAAQIAQALAAAGGTSAQPLPQPGAGEGTGPDGTGAGGAGMGGAGMAAAAAKATETAAELTAALGQALGAGSVSVAHKDGKVVVSVGAGGAFDSGSDSLTPEAREIMARIAFASMQDGSTLTVTGYTDTVPVSAGSPFRDNLGLASARAAAVVRELAASGLVAPDRLSAVGRGEADPVADNATEEGRRKNRRIEIEIAYAP